MLDDFVPEKAERHLRELASAAPVLTLSARSGDGMQYWLDWLRSEHAAAVNGETLRPAIQPDGQQMHAHEAARQHHHGGHHHGHD